MGWFENIMDVVNNPTQGHNFDPYASEYDSLQQLGQNAPVARQSTPQMPVQNQMPANQPRQHIQDYYKRNTHPAEVFSLEQNVPAPRAQPLTPKSQHPQWTQEDDLEQAMIDKEIMNTFYGSKPKVQHKTYNQVIKDQGKTNPMVNYDMGADYKRFIGDVADLFVDDYDPNKLTNEPSTPTKVKNYVRNKAMDTIGAPMRTPYDYFRLYYGR